jgi:hypothetical protein
LLLYALATSTGTAVFIIRTLAIRSSRWPLSSFLWFLWAIMTSAWTYWATLLRINQIPAMNEYHPTCTGMHGIPKFTWGLYLYIGLFDFFILVLTLQSQIKDWKTLREFTTLWKKSQNDIFQVFFLDSILWFGLSFSVTMVELIWVYIHRQDEFYTALLAPV